MKKLPLVLALAACALRPSVRVNAASTVVTRGSSRCRDVALTFDLCPVTKGSGFDVPLVQYLVDHQIPATFFASGAWIATHDKELRWLVAQPFFEIGTHGETHAHMPKLKAAAQAAEVAGPIHTLSDRYGVHATLFRPPYGEYDAETVRAADAAGQTVVMWSVVSGDPDAKLTAAAIVDDVTSRMKNGSVVIFHANGRGWHTREVVPVVYEKLRKTGLAPKTITGLRAGCGVAAEAR